MRVLAQILSVLTNTGIALMLAPIAAVVLLALSVMYVGQWVELHGHFKGDKSAMDREIWRNS